MELPEQWYQLAERKGIRPTVRGIAEAADVAPSTVSRLIFQGRTSDRTTHAISEALGITTSDVLRYARVPAGSLGPWDPPKEAHLLSGKQRKALDDLIRAFAADDQGATMHALGSGKTASFVAEVGRLRDEIRQARDDVADWEDRMPDTEGGRQMLRELRQKVRDLELQEYAASERLISQSNESSL